MIATFPWLVYLTNIHIQGTLPNVCLVIVTTFPQLVYFASINELSECNKSWLDQSTNIGEFHDCYHIYWQWVVNRQVVNIRTMWQVSTSDKCLSDISVMGMQLGEVGAGIHNSLWVPHYVSAAMMNDGSAKWHWPLTENLKWSHLHCKPTKCSVSRGYQFSLNFILLTETLWYINFCLL